MPDLPDRRKREREIVEALMLLWKRESKPISDWNGFERRLREAIRPHLERTFIDASKQIDTEKSFASDATKWAIARTTELADGVRKTVHENTERIKLEGSPIENAFSEAEAETIAATEITNAVSEGEAIAVAGLALLGVKMRPRWFTEQDARVCDICGPLHGSGPEVFQRVNFSGPPAHPRCRCWLEYDRKT